MTWIAQGGGQSFAFHDGNIVEPVAGATVVRVGDGAETLPAPVLPQCGRSVPALSQTNPPDIIAGWVRIWIAGFLADHNDWDGVICVHQGDVSHWLHISAREVVSCQSFLTPRLVVALGGAETASADAVADSMSRPERLAAHLRVAEVTGNTSDITGHLIGAELAATRPYWLGQQVVLISESGLGNAYDEAIRAQAAPVEAVHPRDLIEAGLAALGGSLGL